MEKKFNIIFSGQIIKNAELSKVIYNLAKLFKTDSSKIKPMFSGKTISLKKNLSEQVAKQYKQALNKAGAVVYIQAQASINESNEENQQVQQKPLPTTENFNLLPAGTKILDKLVREKALVIDSSELSVNSTNSDFDDCKESVEAFSTDISGLDMCEAGDELTDEDDEIVVPEIYDFDKLSIAETGEKILEAKKEKQLEVDISHLDVEKVNPFS